MDDLCGNFIFSYPLMAANLKRNAFLFILFADWKISLCVYPLEGIRFCGHLNDALSVDAPTKSFNWKLTAGKLLNDKVLNHWHQ